MTPFPAAAQKIVVRELARNPRLPKRLGVLSRDAVLAFLRVLDRCFAALNRAAGFRNGREVVIRETALQNSFAALLAYLNSEADAANFLLSAWSNAARLFGGSRKTDLPRVDCEPLEGAGRFSEETFREYLATYNTALAELLREHVVEPKARQLIRELLARLDVSYDELGRVLQVSGETVRRWEKGASEIPTRKLAFIETAAHALRRILRIIRPASLPSVIRRPAGLFDGATALDWIRAGRIGEVADRYEVAFAYQG
jgi:DNA-binding transcriptional regulator YiaG